MLKVAFFLATPWLPSVFWGTQPLPVLPLVAAGAVVSLPKSAAPQETSTVEPRWLLLQKQTGRSSIFISAPRFYLAKKQCF